MGIVLLSYYLISTMIPRSERDKTEGVNRAWGPVFGLGTCGLVLMFTARFLDFPDGPEGVRWTGLVYAPYALGAAAYSIYFRRELSRWKSFLGVLPFFAPIILALAIRSMS